MVKLWWAGSERSPCYSVAGDPGQYYWTLVHTVLWDWTEVQSFDCDWPSRKPVGVPSNPTEGWHTDPVWLLRYPQSMCCLHDSGQEFGSLFQTLLCCAGIPQSNGSIKQVHKPAGLILWVMIQQSVFLTWEELEWLLMIPFTQLFMQYTNANLINNCCKPMPGVNDQWSTDVPAEPSLCISALGEWSLWMHLGKYLDWGYPFSRCRSLSLASFGQLKRCNECETKQSNVVPS